MVGAAEDWREDRQDERIGRLEQDLREAREKLWELERRPLEWLLKTEVAILWILLTAILVLTLVEIANKH
jgi:hypothetical protein